MWFSMVVSLVLSVVTAISARDINVTFAPGDPRRCFLEQQVLDVDHTAPLLNRFEVLPGGGWDNLRNKDAGLVMRVNFSECKTTDDRRYLIPNNVYIVPLKTSQVETFAEMFDHWNNFTSTTSTSVNVEAGLNLPHFGVSGKFSDEWETNKEHQVNDKSVTTRVQVRYVRYSAKLQPDSDLDPAFEKRLRIIARHIQLNMTEMAAYDSQLLVRDFGTHVVTSVDAGAALVQVDHIKSSFVRDAQTDRSKILASASASFFGVFHFGIDVSHSTSKETIDQYTSSRTSSVINTIGGPAFHTNTSIDWATSIDNELVPMDRSGDPIYYVITPQILPDLPIAVVRQVYDEVKSAVELYYKFNTYHGCTNQDAPNFSFLANVDDESCHARANNFTFGGVYTTCAMSPWSNAGDLCGSQTQKNPQTGDFRCTAAYEPILLHQSTLSSRRTDRRCHSCGFLGWSTCCDDYLLTSSATVVAYWCAARGAVPAQSGYLFGGVYTQRLTNPLTGASTCPVNFYPLKLGLDLMVCVSDDYELGYRYAVPFGGLYSCSCGNPMVLDDTTKNQVQSSAGGRQTRSLGAYMHEGGASSWPRACPTGFSQHLATVEQDCELNYCIKTNALSSQKLPAIRRPPFMEKPRNDVQVGNGSVPDRGSDQQTWIELSNATVIDQKIVSPISVGHLSSGAVAGIAIAATLMCLVVATLGVWGARRRKAQSGQGERARITSRGHRGLYGAIAEDGGEDDEVPVMEDSDVQHRGSVNHDDMPTGVLTSA